MLELHYKKEGHIRKNIYVTKDGVRIGTELPSFVTSYYWTYITDSCHAELDLRVAGDFVLLFSSEVYSIECGVYLCLIEEQPKSNISPNIRVPGKGEVDDTVDIWPIKPIYTNYQTTFAGFKSAFANQVTHRGAIHLPINPAVGSANYYKKDEMADTTAKGRWLFPHPAGSRAAFEHMQKTTLEDDYRRLLPYLEAQPELTKTFSDLV